MSFKIVAVKYGRIANYFLIKDFAYNRKFS